MKYYFNDDGYCGFCYNLQYWKEYMKDNSIKEMKLIEAKTRNDPDVFFCTVEGEPGEKGSCSKSSCDSYDPRNGKSGICRHYRQLYQYTDKEIKLINPKEGE